MANEGYGTNTSTLERDINDELTCGVCLELFTAPVMLPCSHNFCQQCINSILDVNLSMSQIQYGPPSGFHCPLCHHAVPINKYQFNKWPINRALENIVNLYKKSAPCEIFDDSWYSDLEPTTGNCERHDQPLNKYCDSCTEVICTKCEKSEHSSQRANHRVEPMKHAVRAYQTDIASSLTILKKKLMPLNDRMKQLERLLNEIQVNADQSKRQIDDQFSDLMKLTRSKQTDLMQKIQIEVKQQREPITEDLNRCQSVQTTVQDLIKKLSHIRRIKDTTLLLQSMKNIYKQFDILTGFDIDHCLRSQMQHSSSCPTFNLHTQHAYTAIENLDWETSNRTEKGLSSDCQHVSVHTQTVDDVVEIMSQDVGNHGDVTVHNSRLSDLDQATGMSNSSKPSDKSVTSPDSMRGNSLDERCVDEPDGDMPAGSGKVPVGDPLTESRDSNNVTDQHKDIPHKQGNKSNKHDKQVLNKPFHDLGLGDVSPGVKGHSLGDVSPRVKGRSAGDVSPGVKGHSSGDVSSRVKGCAGDVSPRFQGHSVGDISKKGKGSSSFQKDKKSPSRGKIEKDVTVSSTSKGKHSKSENNHAAAIKSFVARRRTMSPSVSATSLETMSKSYSGEKLTLHPDTARRNTSSPALRSLEDSYEYVDTNGNQKGRARSNQRQEGDGACKESDIPTNMNPMSSADTANAKSSRSINPSSSGMNTTPSPKQKSFTIQPIDLKLDLNLDEDGMTSSRITNV